MKLRIALIIFLGSVAMIRADETIRNAQQALKDQGFYYGEITGEKNADTSAAIRRYQIRNGLQITGELDEETVRSLGASGSAPAQPAAKASPSAHPSPPDRPNEPSSEIEPETQAPRQPFANGPQDNNAASAPEETFWNRSQNRQVYPSSPATVVPPADGLFAGTPYGTAPPEVQRNIVASAQRILTHRDLYRGEIDGIFGPNMEFSLRAYQSRVGLPVTGRLDLETLAALELLPGAHRPVFNPRRPVVRPRPEPVVRGEWIRE